MKFISKIIIAEIHDFRYPFYETKTHTSALLDPDPVVLNVVSETRIISGFQINGSGGKNRGHSTVFTLGRPNRAKKSDFDFPPE